MASAGGVWRCLFTYEWGRKEKEECQHVASFLLFPLLLSVTQPWDANVHIQCGPSPQLVLSRKALTGVGEIAQRVRSMGCSTRGPKFESEHPHGGSQPSLTPGQGDGTSSYGLHRHLGTHMIHSHT